MMLTASQNKLLAENFLSPPVSAKPWVYWAWMNGNVSKEGITADLEAMQRVGIGGVLVINVSVGIPQGPVDYMSAEWRELLKYSANEAERLGIEMALYNSDGWQLSGGPWITPETGMKELVWSEAQVEGQGKFNGILAQPSTNLGFYRDVAVLAFPSTERCRLNGSDSQVKITSSVPGLDGSKLIDGDPASGVAFPETLWKEAEYIQFELPAPQPARTVVIHVPRAMLGSLEHSVESKVELQVSDDGRRFQSVSEFGLDFDFSHFNKLLSPTITMSFDEVTSKIYRIVIRGMRDFQIGEIEILGGSLIPYWELKSGLVRKRGHGGEASVLSAHGKLAEDEKLPENSVIKPDQLINLTGHMDAGGCLVWDIPEGSWTILRIGYTATGKRNGQSTKAGSGLECDKLSPKGIETIFANVADVVAEDFGPLTGKVLKYVHSDSWECGIHTWTDEFREEFRKRRGYDLIPYLPVVAGGRIVAGRSESERVLWDYRQTISEMFTEYYHHRLQSLCRERGLRYQAEAAGRQQYMYDPINYKSGTDIPIGEFWLGDEQANGVRVDCRVAASVAHTYGKEAAGAEAFTSHFKHAKWSNDPYSLKALGDKAFCTGINRFLFHRYAHQPWQDVKPGVTYGPWGIHFERTNTWWEQGKAWVHYLGRCGYMLQAGKFVADIIHYIGDDVPNYLGHRDEIWLPIPKGNDYDGCNTEILHQMSVENGRIVLPSGMSYRVLLLPDGRRMRPENLRKIRELVKSGATVIGPKPLCSPSLENYPQCDTEVRQLADEIWGSCDGNTVKEHVYGKGLVIWGKSFEEIFAELRVEPDFSYNDVSLERTAAEPEVLYIHRRTADADIYFVSNQENRKIELLCTFRVQGKRPEFWCPVSGEAMCPAAYKQSEQGVQIPFSLDPSGSVFVVFRSDNLGEDPITSLKVNGAANLSVQAIALDNGAVELLAWEAGTYTMETAAGKTMTTEIAATGREIAIEGPWELHFPLNWGAPDKIELKKLISWTEHQDPGVHYFSGTVTYTKEFIVPDEVFTEEDTAVFIDFGQIKYLAEVKLNGIDLGIVWKPPFRVEATSVLKPGRNLLKVDVTNNWVNRIIGDERLVDDMGWELLPNGTYKIIRKWPEWFLKGEPRPSQRYTFASVCHYDENSPLQESGLLGPVRIVTARRILFN